jgi:hypothetical protein
MMNGMVNGIFKVIFHAARPFWYTSKVKMFGVYEESFGLPSGHAQNGVIVWGTIANQVKRRWVWIVVSIVIFLIGLSRIYLAVHFPHDVLFGWVIGIVFLLIFLRLEKPVLNWIKRYSTGAQIAISFLSSMLFISIYLVARLSLGAWTLPKEWIDIAGTAFPENLPINPLSISGFLANPGAFFGLAAGWIWISSLGGFTTRDMWWKLILRYLVGVVGVLILYLGLGAIFPKTETLLAYFLRYLRYALIGFWSAGLAPWLFVKLKLASQLKYLPKLEKAGQQASADLH